MRGNTFVAGFARIQPVRGNPSEFLRIQLPLCRGAIEVLQTRSCAQGNRAARGNHSTAGRSFCVKGPLMCSGTCGGSNSITIGGRSNAGQTATSPVL